MGAQVFWSRIQIIGCGSSLALGLFTLFGYAINYESAWRLTSGYPATHPLSALCLALLGFGLLTSVSKGRAICFAARGAVVLAAAIAVLRLLGSWVGTSLFDAMTPFKDVLAAQAAAGMPIFMGPNTAHTVLAIALSDILRWNRWPIASQLLACCAVGVLFIGMTGYVEHLHAFYGRMAPLTLAGTFMLSLSALASTHQQGFVRFLVAQSEPGRLARLLLGCSTPAIILIGWVLVHYSRIYGMSEKVGALLAYQTTAIIILSWILITAATARADVIDRRRQSAESLLLKAATTDTLTGLLSRNQLEIYRTAGEKGRPKLSTAELFIDLDRFRAVNEAFGHSIGDEFLSEVGRRLQFVAGLHKVARLGGDEFAIYCVGISLEEAELIGSAVVTIIAMPFNIHGHSFRLTASVGVSHSDPAGAIDLRAAADNAMHVAKSHGGNQVATFHASMYEEWRSKIELEQFLHDALERGDQLSLVYQPVVEVNDRMLVAVEALARWTHPELGPIPPNKFIPLAEATGLIVPLGLKLMANAVAQAAKWRDQHGVRAPRINLNISPLQFANGDVISDLKRMLDRHNLMISAICIEVTEGTFSDSRAVGSLEIARDMGFTVAMDDFGVGYSSLSQLPRLPVTTVKLDRSFIVASTETTRGATMLASIIQLAHGLKLTVVAEGVETQDQLGLLSRIGCDAVQGYICARPMNADELNVWLEERPHPQPIG
jgi:diguanylate cyclase (GGDEF)-like protein